MEVEVGFLKISLHTAEQTVTRGRAAELFLAGYPLWGRPQLFNPPPIAGIDCTPPTVLSAQSHITHPPSPRKTQ